MINDGKVTEKTQLRSKIVQLKVIFSSFSLMYGNKKTTIFADAFDFYLTPVYAVSIYNFETSIYF